MIGPGNITAWDQVKVGDYVAFTHLIPRGFETLYQPGDLVEVFKIDPPRRGLPIGGTMGDYHIRPIGSLRTKRNGYMFCIFNSVDYEAALRGKAEMERMALVEYMR